MLFLAVIVTVCLPFTAYLLTDAIHTSVGALEGWVGAGTQFEKWWEKYFVDSNEGIGVPLHSIFRTVGGFLPAYTTYWIDVVVKRPFASAAILSTAYGLYLWNGALRDLIVERARRTWFSETRAALAGLPSRGPQKNSEGGVMMAFARFMRNSTVVGQLHRAITGLAIPGLALLIFFGAVIVTVSRTTVSYRAGQGSFCKATFPPDKVPPPLPEGESRSVGGFEIDNPCWASGVWLEKGRHYRVWIEMIEPYIDRTLMADIAGFHDFSPPYLVGLPIRRWWAAEWFQPIARIGAIGDVEWPLEALDGAEPVQGGRQVILPSSMRLGWFDKMPETEYASVKNSWSTSDSRKTFVSQFAAPDDGELFLYVNDAIAAIPFGPTIWCLYDNNRGKAKITIERVPVPTPSENSMTR